MIWFLDFLGNWADHFLQNIDLQNTSAHQDDPFFLELTVYETLCFASQLAGRSLMAAQHEARPGRNVKDSMVTSRSWLEAIASRLEANTASSRS